MMRKAAVVGALCLLALVTYGQKRLAEDEVLFSVDDAAVHASEFTYLYNKNHQGKPEEFTKEKITAYLDLFVNFKLKVKEATDRGLDTTRAFNEELNSYKSELKKPFIASPDQVSMLVREAYDRLQQEVRAAHLLIGFGPDPASADTLAAWNKIIDLRRRIVAGEQFEKLAAEYSEDPSAKENGGDLGYFTALVMVYPFETAAYSLSIGEISQPVKTRFGYHLILLKDKRTASGEVEVSHIFFRGKDTKVKNKAFEAYDQLRAGKKWEDVCRENSDDAGTKDNGGRLQKFSAGALSSVPEFESMAFSMQTPGEYSDPFESRMGWHIIRLENRIPVPTFEEMEPSLKRRISRDERLQIGQEAELARRKKEFNMIENREIIDNLMHLADTSLQKGRWSVLISEPHKDDTLFASGNDVATVRNFYAFVKGKQRPSALPAPEYFRQLYNQFTEERIGELEDRKLQKENPDYRNLLKEYREGLLLFSVMETEVWNKASADSLGQRQYYTANTAKYSAGERVYARILGTPDAAFLEEIKTMILNGDTLKPAQLRRLKVVTSYRGYERGDHKAIDSVAWSVGLHQTQSEGMHYLVEIERLIPAGVKTFDEARASVISDYQDSLERSWIDQLKKKHAVKINKKTVKTVVASLEKK
jgi:peptidyl-prolyl cis-trans isomerase SurA